MVLLTKLMNKTREAMKLENYTITGLILQLFYHGYRINLININHLLQIESLKFKRNIMQNIGNMFHLLLILLIAQPDGSAVNPFKACTMM